MTMFLMKTITPGPLEFSFLKISSISGGKTNASVVEQRAPMREMKSPRFGTNSAIKTVGRTFVVRFYNRRTDLSFFFKSLKNTLKKNTHKLKQQEPS